MKVRGGPDQLCHLGPEHFRPLRQAAQRSPKRRSSRSSGLRRSKTCLSRSRMWSGITNWSATATAGRSKSCWSPSRRICSMTSTRSPRSSGFRTAGCRRRADGALQRVSLQLQRSARLLAAGGSRRPDDQPDFRRARQGVSPAASPSVATPSPPIWPRSSARLFAAAEERKKREGYVSLGGAYADDSESGHRARKPKSSATR